MNANQIKQVLIKHIFDGGLHFDPAFGAIGNEVLYSRSRRRTDLLIMQSQFHALEIKSVLDTLKKLPDQIAECCRTFDYVSVVADHKHIKDIHQIIPHKVGIIVVKDGNVSTIREPVINKRLDKNSLLMFLNRQQVLQFLRQQKISVPPQKSVDEVREIVYRQFSSKAIREVSYKSVMDIYLPLFRRFCHEKMEYPLSTDDIQELSAKLASNKLSR